MHTLIAVTILHAILYKTAQMQVTQYNSIGQWFKRVENNHQGNPKCVDHNGICGTFDDIISPKLVACKKFMQQCGILYAVMPHLKTDCTCCLSQQVISSVLVSGECCLFMTFIVHFNLLISSWKI